MNKVLARIRYFLTDQPVLCISALAALLSMAFVPPNPSYADYIDLRVLGLLFSLMLSVAGLQQAGLFAWVAKRLLKGSLSVRTAVLILTLLCFFSSMLVTNDVALITFVPFTLFLFTVGKRQSAIAWAVVLQTLAANLGSMVTPMGNPQNLFIFAHYDLDVVAFALVIAPFAALSLVLLVVCALAFSKGGTLEPSSRRSGIGVRAAAKADSGAAEKDDPGAAVQIDPVGMVLFSALFVTAVLAVLRVAPLLWTLAVTVALTLALRRKTLLKVDYALLATFVCFFVFSGNLAHIPLVKDALESLMAQGPFAVSLVASQVISNVPAAVLLAPFTDAWPQLLLGVDIGGLGTPIASLASLISLEFYRRSRAGSLRTYLVLFLGANVAFLAANIALGLLLGSFVPTPLF